MLLERLSRWRAKHVFGAAGIFLASNLYLFSVLSKRAREVDEIKTHRLAAKLNNGERWLEQTSPYPKRKIPSDI
eukprot:g4334.t1